MTIYENYYLPVQPWEYTTYYKYPDFGNLLEFQLFDFKIVTDPAHPWHHAFMYWWWSLYHSQMMKYRIDFEKVPQLKPTEKFPACASVKYPGYS